MNEPGGVAWSYLDIVLVIVAGLVGSLVASLLVFGFGGGGELSVGSFSIVFAGQAGGSLVAMYVMSRRRGTGDLARDFGLALRARDVWGLLLGMGAQVGVSVLLAPVVKLLFPQGPPEQTVAEIAGTARGVGDVILVVLAVVVLAPIVEEAIYRGMLLGRLRRSFGTRWAVVGSAAIFAVIHLLDPNAIAVVPGLFLVGLVLGALVVWRGDLSLAIWTHGGVNLTAVLLLLFGSDLLDYLQRLAQEAGKAVVVVRMLHG